MKTQVQYIEEHGLYWDTEKYWKEIGGYMYGWDTLSQTVHNHIKRHKSDFIFLTKEQKKDKPPAEYLSEDQRMKPIAPHIEKEQARINDIILFGGG